MRHRKTGTLAEELLTLGEQTLEQLIASRHDFKNHAQRAMQGFAQRCELVTRDDLDAVVAMIAKARATQEEQDRRLSAVEKKLGLSSASPKVTTKNKNLRSVKLNNRHKKA